MLHAAGWLEGGLCASFEKFALDVELLRQFQVQAKGIGFTDEELAFDALEGDGARRPVPVVAAHARALQGVALHVAAVPDARLRDVGDDGSPRPPRSPPTRRGSSSSRATRIPGLDPAIDEELKAYMASRRDAPDLFVED